MTIKISKLVNHQGECWIFPSYALVFILGLEHHCVVHHKILSSI